MKVKVTAHDKYLVITTINSEEDKNFIPVGGSRIGNVVIQTDKYLGMSKEAKELLNTIKPSGDDIGDVSAWKTTDNKYCFSWLGGINKIINMEKAETDNQGIIDVPYITIPNIVPDEAINVINGMEG